MPNTTAKPIQKFYDRNGNRLLGTYPKIQKDSKNPGNIVRSSAFIAAKKDEPKIEKKTKQVKDPDLFKEIDETPSTLLQTIEIGHDTEAITIATENETEKSDIDDPSSEDLASSNLEEIASLLTAPSVVEAPISTTKKKKFVPTTE